MWCAFMQWLAIEYCIVADDICHCTTKVNDVLVHVRVCVCLYVCSHLSISFTSGLLFIYLVHTASCCSTVIDAMDLKSQVWLDLVFSSCAQSLSWLNYSLHSVLSRTLTIFIWYTWFDNHQLNNIVHTKSNRFDINLCMDRLEIYQITHSYASNQQSLCFPDKASQPASKHTFTCIRHNIC